MYCIIRRGLLGVLGVNSGTLHLILLPPVRKFGRTRFLSSFPTPRPAPFILPAFSALLPRPAPLAPLLPLPPLRPLPSPSHFCIRSALSHSVTVLVSGKPRRAA